MLQPRDVYRREPCKVFFLRYLQGLAGDVRGVPERREEGEGPESHGRRQREGRKGGQEAAGEVEDLQGRRVVAQEQVTRTDRRADGAGGRAMSSRSESSGGG